MASRRRKRSRRQATTERPEPAEADPAEAEPPEPGAALWAALPPGPGVNAPADVTCVEEEADVPGLDAPDEESETGPLRRCVVTRARLPKERMFRFVVGPDRALVPDLAGKLPGRGLWLSASGDVLEGRNGTRPHGAKSGGSNAGGKFRDLTKAMARAARGPVLVPPDLSAVLESALIRRIGELLGLARRSGQAIAGFEKARDWMRPRAGGPPRGGLVLQASDGSEAERARFRSVIRGPIQALDPLTGAELGRIFGHETVVHVAVAAGKLASAIAVEADRLAGLKNRPPGLTMEVRYPGAEPGVGSENTSQWATGRATAATNDVTGTNG